MAGSSVTTSSARYSTLDKVCSRQCRLESAQLIHSPPPPIGQPELSNGCRSLVYVAHLEDYVLREDLVGKVATCLSSIASKPTCERDEIPVLLVKLDPGGNVFTAKRWSDFPDIFCETWKSLVLPNLKGCVKYVTVLSLPMGDREFYFFSPIATMIRGWTQSSGQ